MTNECPMCLGQKHLQAWRNDANGRTTSPVTIPCPECSTPPATGAEAMREAAAKVAEPKGPRPKRDHPNYDEFIGLWMEAEGIAAQIRALPLPAPELPEVRPSKCPKCGNSRAQAAHGVCPHSDCPMEGYQT